jgi:hypothetical protein
MLAKARPAVFIAFIVSLAVWVGGGVFHSIGSHSAWYTDPVRYIRAPAGPEATVNPWPLTTAVLALLTLLSLAVFATYRGPGYKRVLAVLGATFVILVATGVYFVPTLIKLGNHAALTEAQIVSLSHTWIHLNVIRIVIVLGLLVLSQTALMRLASRRDG